MFLLLLMMMLLLLLLMMLLFLLLLVVLLLQLMLLCAGCHHFLHLTFRSGIPRRLTMAGILGGEKSLSLFSLLAS